MELRDFHPTPAQRRFYEQVVADTQIRLRVDLDTGRATERRYGSELFIAAIAANDQEAALAIEDFRTRGFALLSDDGKRIEPPDRNGARFTMMKFDEEKSPPHTLPCLDCDEAGCEKCGGTGRRRQT